MAENFVGHNTPKKNILEIDIRRKIACCAAVAMWNYWDQEHLDVVHPGYTNVEIIYENKECMLSFRDVEIPLFGIKVTTPIMMQQIDEETIVTTAVQFGIKSKTTVTIKDTKKDNCELHMNYKFYLNGWQKILKPLLKNLIPKWNETVWVEDLPLKLRRQKVMRYNFKDFYGLPDKIEDRNYEGKIKLSLPIPRLKISPRGGTPENPFKY